MKKYFMWILYVFMFVITIYSASATNYYANNYVIDAGVYDSGSINDTFVMDNDYLVFREDVSGLSVRFFLEDGGLPNMVIVNARYRGGGSHYVFLEVYDYSNSSFKQKAIIPSSSNFYLFNIPITEDNINIDGEVIIRFNHNDINYVSSHYLDIDYLSMTLEEENNYNWLIIGDDLLTMLLYLVFILVGLFLAFVYDAMTGGAILFFGGIIALFNGFVPVISFILIVSGIILFFEDGKLLK